MQINGYTLTDRNNRPGILERVGVPVYFINGGVYTDPYAISGVGIFNLSSNATGSPSAVLGVDNLIVSGAPVRMFFANSAVETSDVIFSQSGYTPGATASGIFKLGTGRYAVVLDGGVQLSGVFEGNEIANTVTQVGDYIDVWVVKFTQGGSWNVLINEFHMFNDTFYTITEPLLVTTKNFLYPKEIKFSSRVNLKVGVDITLGNKNISNGIKNLFRDNVITGAQFRIVKLNEGYSNLPNHVEVSGFSDTSAFIDITSDNTMVFNFDSTILSTHAQALAGNLGSLTGIYALQAKYNILDETKITDLMPFQIT